MNRHIHQLFHPSNINATYMVDQCLRLDLKIVQIFAFLLDFPINNVR